MLFGSGIGAHAADDDSFFRDLDQAEGLTSRAEPSQSSPSSSSPNKPSSNQLSTSALPSARLATSEDVKPRGDIKSFPQRAEAAISRSTQSSVDALLEKSLKWDETPDDVLATKRLIPRDWRPEHTKSASPAAPTLGASKDADPEPDHAIAPVSLPSKDPLDPSTPSSTPTVLSAPKLETLPPLEAAVKSALDKLIASDVRVTTAERRKEHRAIAFFYASHGFGPIWSRDGKAVDAVDSILKRLAHDRDDGLSVAGVPKALIAQGGLENIAESELALTEAVVSYARQATGSRVDPRSISPLIGQRPELADPADVLDMLTVAGTSAGDKLQGLNPIEPRYVALRDKLASMRAARLPDGSTPVPEGPILHVGMHDPRVPLLRSRFHLDASLWRHLDDLRYDSQLAQAVAEFQRANGMAASGTLTNSTVVALAGGKISHLEGALVTNMEMWRWMPRSLGTNRIEVNVPDYVVSVFHDDKAVAQNRVVVGKVDTPTPLFSNTMKYLIVNPYWNVPQSIIKKEMLPKAGGDLSYLNGRGYFADWHGGQWAVKQLPGPKNALGRIKFLFPNDYSVYLHDTPSKALFSAAKRAFSHGCVRVDQPFAFGEAVLNDAVPEGGRKHWSEEKLEEFVGDKEHYVNLPVALPIHIEYFTASIEPGTGRVKLGDDVYGYAHAVAVALGQESQVAPAPDRKPRLVAEHVRRRSPEATIDDSLDPR